MLDCLGTLDRPQLSCIANLMQREIYLTSGLPITETGFPTIKLAPGTFCDHILDESDKEEIPSTLYLIDDHANLVLQKDTRLCHATLSESMSPDSGSDTDEDNDKNDADVEHRTTTFLFWINKKSNSPEYTREMLNDTRDVIIRCIRKSLPQNEETDEILDHMLAGAYIRQMMVVNTPEQGPNAQTAIFCVETFEDFPQTLVFKFLAGSSSTPEGLIGPMNFPIHSNAMIAIEKPHLKWLSSSIAKSVAKPPQKLDKSITAPSDSESDSDDNQTKETQIDDKLAEAEQLQLKPSKVWEETTLDIPTIHFKSVAPSKISNMGYDGVQVIQVKEKRSYCDEAWNNFCISCYCRKQPSDGQPQKGDTSYKPTSQPTLTKRLVEQNWIE